MNASKIGSVTAHSSIESPAVCLCADVLEYLFLLGAADIVGDRLLKRKSVLSYAQTCRAWRSVALSSKSLWVDLLDVDLFSWSWNETVIRRSHPLPITIGYSLDLSRDSSSVEAELEYLDRIRHYSLGFAQGTWDLLVRNLRRPARSMKSLTLSFHHPYIRPILPRDLFATSAPLFQSLTLNRCSIDLSTPLLSQLVALHLFHINSEFSTAPTALEWLKLIRRMPTLKDLILNDAISAPQLHGRRQETTSGGGDDGNARCNLVHLEYLSLEGSMPALADLLDSIEVPALCFVVVVSKDSHADDGDVSRIIKGSLSSLAKFIGERGERRPAIPLFLSANELMVRLCVDEGVLQHALSAVSEASRTLLTTSTLPTVLLVLCVARGSSWESLLSPLISALTGQNDVLLRNAKRPQNHIAIAASIVSLALDISSAHPDVLPLLREAENVEALLRLSSHSGTLLLDEMRLRRRSHQEVVLPRLSAISFNDDHCLYGRSWSLLEGYIKDRASSPPPPVRTPLPVRKVVFPSGSFLPQEGVDELATLGVAVEYTQRSRRCFMI